MHAVCSRIARGTPAAAELATVLRRDQRRYGRGRPKELLKTTWTGAAADNDAEALAVHLPSVGAAVGDRHLCSRHSEMRDVIRAAASLSRC